MYKTRSSRLQAAGRRPAELRLPSKPLPPDVFEHRLEPYFGLIVAYDVGRLRTLPLLPDWIRASRREADNPTAWTNKHLPVQRELREKYALRVVSRRDSLPAYIREEVRLLGMSTWFDALCGVTLEEAHIRASQPLVTRRTAPSSAPPHRKRSMRGQRPKQMFDAALKTVRAAERQRAAYFVRLYVGVVTADDVSAALRSEINSTELGVWLRNNLPRQVGFRATYYASIRSHQLDRVPRWVAAEVRLLGRQQWLALFHPNHARQSPGIPTFSATQKNRRGALPPCDAKQQKTIIQQHAGATNRTPQPYIDALDHVVRGGSFESNRKRH